jgi:hypothetical protein
MEMEDLDTNQDERKRKAADDLSQDSKILKTE